MKINVLPTEIANMIAAGEVVERPASVVKELVENCIDAGADSITVEIKKGGIPYIRVTDNGCGINEGDIELAFKRHATSKIKTAADLDAIGTLGFRGEALASIAAVARVEVFSKTPSSDLGRCVVIEGGNVLENSEAGCPDGTTMVVRNLFFNTPARMKFLKSDSTEAGYVTEIINKLVLSHPEISFKYINNGKTVLTSSGDGKLLSSIYTVFGGDYAKNMTEVFYEENGFKVEGYIGNSRLARKDRRHQVFFVNSRNIMSKIMSGAVSEAYKNTVMTGRYPVCVLKVHTHPSFVDVNVHPAKIEVRFSDEKKTYNMVYWAVKNALSDNKFIPEIEIKSSLGHKGAEGSLVKNAPVYDGKEQIDINFLRESYITPPPKKAEEKIVSKPQSTEEKKFDNLDKADTKKPFFKTPDELSVKKASAEAKDEGNERFSHLKEPEDMALRSKMPQTPSYVREAPQKEETEKSEREEKPITADIDFKLIGQAFGTYILLQMDDDLVIIDQHAAHERLYFEELLEEFKESTISSQMLLLPVTMTISPSEADVIEKNKDFFMQLGFEADLFGKDSIVIRSTPGTLLEQDIKDCVSQIITMLSENKKDAKLGLFEDALHLIACKKALKGNHVLDQREQKVLCERVLSLGDGINTCPHGRPIMTKMTKYSLEKQFKRIV